MATWIIQRRYRDRDSGEMAHKALYTFTSEVDAEALAGRLNRAARQVWQFKEYPQFLRLGDEPDWLAAAMSTLGALDPDAVIDEQNPITDGHYTVAEVPEFTEPVEDSPDARELITRAERDFEESP